ncbi:MAG TPA: site-2 protease family protein, partial [Patescibacteria group bacterium]
ATLQFAALLSLNLAVMNLLPIPALDGGRFAFLVVEAITRKRIYPKIEKIVHTAGFFILITLILVVTANDINRFLAGKALFEKFSDLIK